ncbi:MAG: efflux RND transporter periplasmic adaptor subunit [Alphaproteobacteria bacterium]|nr:efflux RND transporter periplasmic adaptor subunit [Alphaproteobacteria bacterium]
MTRLVSMLLLLAACAGSTEPPHDEHADEHAGGHAEVVLTPEAVAAARIVVAPVAEGALSPELTLPARVALDPRKEAIVSAWIGGQVDAIAVRTGDAVRAGQTLGTVQSPELGEAIAAYRAAKARDDAADARLERLKRLEADGVAARSQVLDAEADHAEAEGALEAAEERLRILGVDPSKGDPHAGEHYVSHVPVRSPIAGKVLSTEASVGRRVDPGDTLFHVGDLAQVWLLLDVYERDLAAVRVDQPVGFTLEAWPGERFEGRVDQVGDWVEPTSRTIEVRVVVDNPESKLKPNMFATATLAVAVPDGRRGMVVPADAVQAIDGREVVFVEEEAGRYEARDVTVTERTSAQALIGAGLEPGQRVVHEGAFALKSELEKGELGEGHAH